MNKKLSFIKLLFAIIFVTEIITGCKKDNASSGSPGSNEVWLQNSTFNPSTITVGINTTIKWINKDNFAHTVTSNTGAFNSGTINSGGTFTHQFSTAGSYPYKCTLHPSMTATVIVQ